MDKHEIAGAWEALGAYLGPTIISYRFARYYKTRESAATDRMARRAFDELVEAIGWYEDGIQFLREHGYEISQPCEERRAVTVPLSRLRKIKSEAKNGTKSS